MSRPPTPRLTVVVVVAALAGCASPILKVGGPGFDPADSPALRKEPETMAESLQKLNHVHAAYYEAIRQQQETTQNATTGLVWLGTALVGMAAGNVHRDAILGASLVGGTTYGLARVQLDARRVDVWQEGIEALDCAREASLPLELGKEHREEIVDARSQLRTSSDNVRTAVEAVKKELAGVAQSSLPQAAAARQAIDRATAALSDADTARSAAVALLDASRGRELSTAVDRINAKVTRAINSFAVDISSVKQMVAGIGGFAAIFAPGIDASLGGVFDRYKDTKTVAIEAAKKPGAHALADDTTLQLAMDDLATAMTQLAADQGRLKDLLKSVDTTAVSAALKSCNVAFVASALSLQPASLDFVEKTAASKGFAITGGTAPYEVSLLDAVPDNSVSIGFSGGLSDTAQVKVTAGVTNGTYTVMVKDSSTSRHVQTLTVQVGAKPPAPAPAVAKVGAGLKLDTNPPKGQKVTPPPKPGPVAAPTPPAPAPAPAAASSASAPASAVAGSANPAVAPAWNALAAALRAPGFSRDVQGVAIGVESVDSTATGLRVKYKCDRPSAPIPPDRLRAVLASADLAATTKLRQAQAMDAKATQIDVAPTKSCLKD